MNQHPKVLLAVFAVIIILAIAFFSFREKPIKDAVPFEQPKEEVISLRSLQPCHQELHAACRVCSLVEVLVSSAP